MYYARKKTPSQYGGTLDTGMQKKGGVGTPKNSWGTIERLAKDRQTWKNFVAALNAQRCNGQYESKYIKQNSVLSLNDSLASS